MNNLQIIKFAREKIQMKINNLLQKNLNLITLNLNAIEINCEKILQNNVKSPSYQGVKMTWV